MGFDGPAPPRKRSPNEDVFAPTREPKALLSLKALKPPLVGSEMAGAGVRDEPKNDFVTLPRVDVEPKAGFELPSTEKLL